MKKAYPVNSTTELTKLHKASVAFLCETLCPLWWKKKLFHFSFFIFLITISFSCQNDTTQKDITGKVTVAVAANAQYAMNAMKTAFEKNSSATVELIVGSSGKLTAQILQGAPYDVFVSADMNYPDTLYRADMATSPPVPYAYGILVLWTCKDIDLSKGIRTVQDESVKKIAIANPKTAPYGVETMRILTNFRQYNQVVFDKLVFGESISQVNQYITSGNCEIGFTAKSVVVSPEMKDKGKWVELNPVTYQPIQQGVVITKQGSDKNSKVSKAFTDFLLSEKGRDILAEYGYRLPELERKREAQ